VATVGDLVGDCLRALGADVVFGRPLGGLERVDVPEWGLATLLADAAGRTGRGPGVAFGPDGRLRLSTRPGTSVEALVVSDPDALPSLLASFDVGYVHATREYVLDLDLDAPVSPDAEPVSYDTTGELFALSPTLADLDLVTVAGPGVVRAGQVDALAMFAAQAGCGVLNTWGAKGVFAWDSPYHFGTGGLQARDAELAGVLDADVVIAVGVDDDELAIGALGLSQVLEVEPDQLAALAFTWPEPESLPVRPRLYTELAAALAPLYESDAVPLTPPRAAAALARSRPGTGLVAADAGPAGLWVARTFPTTEPGSVVVPATVAPGFAAAAAFVARGRGRPSLAVTTAPVDEATLGVLALADRLDAVLAVLAWGPDGPLASADDVDDVLAGAWSGASGGVVDLPVDLAETGVLEGVAGPVVAWT
jgi:hypothetical protein